MQQTELVGVWRRPRPSASQALGLPRATGNLRKAMNKVRAHRLDLGQGREQKKGGESSGWSLVESPWLERGQLGLVAVVVENANRPSTGN